MSFFKKIFNFSSESFEEKTAKKQEVHLSLDDSFVHYFLKKGGKFLYCTQKEEIKTHLQNIIKENNWKELICTDPTLTTYLKGTGIEIK
ncbi:MAG: hypothetical protein JKZ00_02140, partial [Flavobacteriaceae bacterium]|nr:hypothetical protein [Flavobacteriaceae bacterium]